MSDQEAMQQRYRELKVELENGQHQLEKLEQQKLSLERTLLRISGAIQVLEELGVNDSGARVEEAEKIAPEID